MTAETLNDKLNEVDSSRKKREAVAFWLAENPQYIKNVFDNCFNEEGEHLIAAAWVLEIICEKYPPLFFKHKNLFFKKLNEIKNDSAVRSCAKICEMLCTYHYVKNTVDFSEVLNKAERKKLTECCFNWLITDQKVACQAPAMECLYFLGMDNDKQWIYPELKNILIKDAAYKSAGYKARARKILNKI